MADVSLGSNKIWYMENNMQSMKTAHVEKNIINLMDVYFAPKTKPIFRVKKDDFCNFKFTYTGEGYTLDYCNPRNPYGNEHPISWDIYREVEKLQTQNSKTICFHDEDEMSVFSILCDIYLIFRLQLEYIDVLGQLYSNKIKALFLLAMTDTDDDDVTRTKHIRFLFWNLKTFDEQRFLNFRNSVLYYQDTALKSLFINTLQDIKQSETEFFIAQDWLELSIALIDFLEHGFSHDDTITEFKILQKKAQQKFQL